MAHPYWPLFDLRIRTPRLELRVPLDDDLVALAHLAAGGIHDPDIMPFLFPWSTQPSPFLERGLLQWNWRQRAEWRPEGWHLGLMVTCNGEPVGVQDLTGRQFVITRVVKTGSWLGRAHQGQGIGKEMRAAVLHLAFIGLGAQIAVSEAYVDNPASIGVSRSLGYEDDGVDVTARRDQAARLLRFRMERARWEALQQEAPRRDDIFIESLEPCLELFGLR